MESRFSLRGAPKLGVLRAVQSVSTSACFRPQVQDDCMVQDNPVQLRVWDYDIMKNDIIGSVYVPT